MWQHVARVTPTKALSPLRERLARRAAAQQINVSISREVNIAHVGFKDVPITNVSNAISLVATQRFTRSPV
jgi:hypothetical protein